MPGFKSILTNIAKQWETKRDQLIESGNRIVEALTDASNVVAKESLPSVDGVVKTCLTQLAARYDDEFGGFSRAPKFPQPGIFRHRLLIDIFLHYDQVVL